MILLGNVECPLYFLHPGPEIPVSYLHNHPMDLFVSNLAPRFHTLVCTHRSNGRKYMFFIGTLYESFPWSHYAQQWCYVVFLVCFQLMHYSLIDVFQAPLQ